MSPRPSPKKLAKSIKPAVQQRRAKTPEAEPIASIQVEKPFPVVQQQQPLEEEKEEDIESLASSSLNSEDLETLANVDLNESEEYNNQSIITSAQQQQVATSENYYYDQTYQQSYQGPVYNPPQVQSQVISMVKRVSIKIIFSHKIIKLHMMSMSSTPTTSSNIFPHSTKPNAIDRQFW